MPKVPELQYRVKVVVFMVDWLMDRCQDAIVTEELDPGLFGAGRSVPAGAGRTIGAGAASGEGRSS